MHSICEIVGVLPDLMEGRSNLLDFRQQLVEVFLAVVQEPSDTSLRDSVCAVLWGPIEVMLLSFMSRFWNISHRDAHFFE